MFMLQIPTVAEQAEFLESCAHCLGIKMTSKDNSTLEKYFIYDHFVSNKGITESYGFIVSYEKYRKSYRPTNVKRSAPEEIQLIVDAIGLHYGE